MVNGMRAEIPSTRHSSPLKLWRLRQAATGRRITLSTGEDISARLIVLANGLNIGLRHTLGISATW